MLVHCSRWHGCLDLQGGFIDNGPAERQLVTAAATARAAQIVIGEHAP
jgi:hypothetical protein